MAKLDFGGKTAWGETEVLIGATGEKGAEGTALVKLGHVKEGSISISQEEGTKKEWKATGGVVIDSYIAPGKLTVSFTVKNLNEEVLERFFEVKSANNKLTIASLSNDKEYTIKIDHKGAGVEVLTFPRTKISAKLLFSEEDGYGLELMVDVLKSEAGGGYLTIQKKGTA